MDGEVFALLQNSLGGEVVNAGVIPKQSGEPFRVVREGNAFEPLAPDMRGHFDSHRVRKARNEAGIHDVNGCLFVAGVAEDALDDGHNALFDFEFDGRFEHAERGAVQHVKVEDALMISHFMSPLDILANMAVGSDGQKVESLQNVAEESAVGPCSRRFGAPDIRQPGFALGSGDVAGCLDIFEDVGIAEHFFEESGRLGEDVRISVFAACAIASRDEDAEMVEARRPQLEFAKRHVEHERQISLERGDFVAQPDKAQVRELAEHRGGDGGHRVREIENEGVGAEACAVFTDVENRRRDAQSMEQPAGAAVLSVHLRNAVLKGDHPVLVPEFKAITHFNRDDDKIRPFQRLASIGVG